VRLLLIVEDDQDTRSTLADLLAELGYSVCDATNRATALAKLRSLHPDLVLLDYGLPAPKDGEEFLLAKASDVEIRAIPVIVLSAYNLPAKMDGTVAVLRKPCDLDRLIEVVQQVIGPPHNPKSTAAA
jgi:CheY-like chemotaxis protein